VYIIFSEIANISMPRTYIYIIVFLTIMYKLLIIFYYKSKLIKYL